MYQLRFIAFYLSLLITTEMMSQAFPSPMENVPFATTFGQDANPQWGDDDNSQVYFVAIPKDWKDAVYLRVFDGDIGGANDEMMGGGFNTSCHYFIYGGNDAYSNKEARKVDPAPGYKSGVLLAEKKIAVDASFDDQWALLATLVPNEGEWSNELNAYVFKIICDGMSGDDANLYKYFVSSSGTENVPIQGVNPFAYELCFRLNQNTSKRSHFYPFIESNVVKVHFHHFDLDSSAYLKVNSIVRKDVPLAPSGNGVWRQSEQKIFGAEQNTSMDYQIRSKSPLPNDAVVYFTNQYGDAIPFFSTPIGGLPQDHYKSQQKQFTKEDLEKEGLNKK